MLKSSTFDEDEATEHKVVLSTTWSNDFETASRRVLDIHGGRSVLAATETATAGAATGAESVLCMLYIDARLAAPIALPFNVVVDGLEVLFDEIEPSPVAECMESDVVDCDKCEEVVKSFSHDAPLGSGSDSVDICIETSSKIAFSVKLTAEECSKFLLESETCFGYTSKLTRCSNRRKSMQGGKEMEKEKVWCRHHQNQKSQYQRFHMYGDRPVHCTWW